MGLRKKVMLPSTHAGIIGGAVSEGSESIFMISPSKFLAAIFALVVIIKLLHLVIG